MHMLHDKADSQRTKIYAGAASSDVYRETAKNVSNIVRNVNIYWSILLYILITYILARL